MPTTEAQWAWVAGVLEGDGCFTHGSKQTPQVALQMRDEDVVRRVHQLTGVGHVNGPYVNTGHGSSPYYRWAVAVKPDVVFVIDRVLPWLGDRRRARALELRTLASVNNHNRFKTHCKRGHLLSGENVYVWFNRNGNPARSCKACRTERIAS
jgi:hypothetical protein